MKQGTKYLLITGGVVLGGAIAIGVYRKVVKDKAFNQSDVGGSPGDVARQLDQAFTWSWTNGHTDEPAIIKAISEVPDRATWEKVKSAYKKKYGSNLIEDLERDLEGEEHDTVQAVIDTFGQPVGSRYHLKAWARLLNFWLNYGIIVNVLNPFALFASPGLDPTYQERVYQVMRSVPRLALVPGILQAHLDEFGQSLLDLMDRRLSDAQWHTVKTILMNKPDAHGKSFNTLFLQ